MTPLKKENIQSTPLLLSHNNRNGGVRSQMFQNPNFKS